MAEKMDVGCARPTGGPVGGNDAEEVQNETATTRKEVSASGWKPGKLTLKPGPELVGKVWQAWKTEMAFN